jgi:flagellar L-ring protein precursor FlgH
MKRVLPPLISPLIVLAAATATVAQTAPPRQSPAGQDSGSAQPPAAQSPAGNPGDPDDREASYERAGGSLARAQSSPGGGPKESNPFAVKPADPKRIKKHDLLTVIINEQSTSQSKDSADLQRTADVNALLSQYINITSAVQLKGVTPANPPQLGFTTDRKFKGEGTVERSDTMNARVQATVIDVLPNGTLVIEATKHIKNDDEEQHFTLTGYVRAEDVTPDNSVLSTQLANLMLEKTTKGAASDTSNRGWLQRFFDFLNPF